ncbi:hypothetical protein [Lentzea sp. NPDC092896]|uniref:hypothetical protein n=1 Tax=Lentzea sp. NPDC092896 TaxID=3364127 RepID=UPI003827D8E5
MTEETRPDQIVAALAAESQGMPAGDFSCPVVMTGGCTYFTDGVHRCCTAPLGEPRHGMPAHPHSCMCRATWSVVVRTVPPPGDEELENALTGEVGAPRVREKRPTLFERYAVSTYVWSEWNRINDQIKNIPWWRFHLRHRARRKYKAFGTALNVLQNYVPTSEES